MSHKERASIVALCGVDGTGKTTLFHRLHQAFDDPHVAFVPRGPSICESLVETHYPRHYGDERDWIDTDFGNTIAVACALDFCNHYYSTIHPLLSKKRLIISDRYSTCFIAFAECLRKPEALAVKLLQSVPVPDLVFHLTANEERLQGRLRSRIQSGEAAESEFEHPICQQHLLEAYYRLFRNYPAPIIEIANDSDIESAYFQILSHLCNL